MKPTNKDLWETLGYYLAMFLGGLGFILLILSANWIAETISNLFKWYIMNQAHVFQEKYTGVQIFVYNCLDEYDAKLQFYKVVINHENWQYLGKKIAKQV